MADFTDLADLLAKMRLFGLNNPGTNLPAEGDPNNWAGIQAQLQGVGSSVDQLNQLQQAAQNALMSQGGYVPAPAPTGVTDPTQLAALNQANVIAQLQQLLSTGMTGFDNAAGQIAQQYQQLNAPINAEGSGYLNQLYGALGIDPSKDATAQQYATSLAQGAQTAGLNQSTDQAWVDKMKALYQMQMSSLIQGISDGSIPLGPEVKAASGGGGGGGGGGRGRRGYGGGGGKGSGGSGWSDPKTTDAMTQAAAVDSAYFNPGFRDALMGVAQNEQEAETLRRIAAQYGGSPRDVNAGLAKNDLPNTEASIDTLDAQKAQNAAYQTVLQQGGRYADTKNIQQKLMEQKAAYDAYIKNPQGEPVTPLTVLQQQQLQGTQAVTNPLAHAPVSDQAAMYQAKLLSPVRSLLGTGKTPQQALLDNHLRQGNDWEQAHNAQIALDKEALRLAQQNPSDQNPTGQGKDFSYNNWSGYVDPVNPQDYEEKAAYYDLLQRAAAVAEEYDPNAGWQDTRLTQKDSSSTKTSQSSKDPADQLFDNSTDPGYVPYSESGGIGFGGGGMTGGMALNDSAKRIVAERLRKDEARRKEQEAVNSNPTQGVANAVLNAVGNLSMGRTNRPTKTSTQRDRRQATPPTPTKPTDVGTALSTAFGNFAPKKTTSLLGKDKPKPTKANLTAAAKKAIKKFTF